MQGTRTEMHAYGPHSKFCCVLKPFIDSITPYFSDFCVVLSTVRSLTRKTFESFVRKLIFMLDTNKAYLSKTDNQTSIGMST